MGYRVRILRRAKREYIVEHFWWMNHRRSAPGLLRSELIAAKRMLSENPELGESCDDIAIVGKGYRRLLLRDSHYWIYYRVDHGARTVTFGSLWPTSRESPTLL